MARKRMITRTIMQTNASVMCLNVTTCEVTVKDFTIGGTFETKEMLLKKLQELFQTDNDKLVNVEKYDTEEVLLGMTEEDFIKNSVVLPPRFKKEVEED